MPGNGRRAFFSGVSGWIRATTLILAVALALAASLFDLGGGVERGLRLWRDSILLHPATGKVALVEIDARSLRAFDSWPWPRGLHARAVQALDRAGASQIGFDVDFSSRSGERGDKALADAIRAARSPVLLPTFRQAQSQGAGRQLENLPIGALRNHAMLASVNISPDDDGMVRRNPYGVVTQGVPRPSMAAMLANASGMIGKSFLIDGAIDDRTIPRISFVDLVNGRVPDAAIRGRSVLVGATAVELGDRYAVPGHQVIPGALVQLLAAETLIQNSGLIDHGPIVPLLLLAALLALRVRWGRVAPGHAALVGIAVLLALPLALEAAGWGTVRIVPALVVLFALSIGDGLRRLVETLRETRLVDAETGLGNARALREARVVGAAHVVVMRMANHNDALTALGSEAMGQLLRAIAHRLGAMTGQPVHRVGNNALGWICDGISTIELTEQIEAGIALFNHPVELNGRPIRVLPVFGLATIDGRVVRALDQALNAADRAAADGARLQWHSAVHDEASDWRLTLAGEIDAAMASGAIMAAYQPKFDIARGMIVSVEALVRWVHPAHGTIPPEDLIAVAEGNGRIEALTLHMLRRALSDRAQWAAAGIDLGVAVNVSALLPAAPGFIDSVERILAEFPGAAARLTLEITESATMTNTDTVVRALERLAALGITISIDDYGTGQSTLTYLKTLPAREIKIDKSFVTALDASRSDQLMVSSTIALAHELGYKVVAEGVETAEILALLADLECDVAQGWYIGRPMFAEALIAFLNPGGLEAAA